MHSSRELSLSSQDYVPFPCEGKPLLSLLECKLVSSSSVMLTISLQCTLACLFPFVESNAKISILYFFQSGALPVEVISLLETEY